MKRLSFFLLASFFVAAAPALAQSAPPQFAQLITIKAQAAQSLGGVLTLDQKQRIAVIARDAEHVLSRSFDGVSASDGPVQSIFTSAVDDSQMSRLALFMGDLLAKAGPLWQAHASQVDALLTPSQRAQINNLRATTLQRLPRISFMGMDLFSALGDGSPFGGFLTDPGSFALLLALPDNNFLSVPKKQARQ